MNLTVYLAGACKNVEDEGRQWREDIDKKLKTAAEWVDAQITVINPVDKYSYKYGNNKTQKEVKEYFMKAIEYCDLLIVNLEDSADSCGTCMEVQHAVDSGIPVIGFNAGKNSYPWVEKVDCMITFETMMQLIDYIRDFWMKI